MILSLYLSGYAARHADKEPFSNIGRRSEFIKFCQKHGPLHPLVRLSDALKTRRYVREAAKIEVDEHSIMFESYSGARYACSPKAIYQQIAGDSRFDGWTLYWAFRYSGQPFLPEAQELGRMYVVRPNSDRYFQVLASCKYWVRNNRVREFVVPKENQVYIQTWHGTPYKKLGFDVGDVKGGSYSSGLELARQNARDADKWTYLLSQSEYYSDCLQSAFHISDEKRAKSFLQLGYPRNDEVVNTVRGESFGEFSRGVRARLGIHDDRKVLLYAPTWRDDQMDEEGHYYFQLAFDLDAMREELGEEWAIVIRLHSLVKNELDFSPWEGFAYNGSEEGDINDLYCIADALCTDYSSVFFDFAVTKRPQYFFWPDFEHYSQNLHGFYMDVSTVPGPKCYNTDDLIAALKRHDKWFEDYGAEYDAFIERFCPNDDGHAAERVVERCIDVAGAL